MTDDDIIRAFRSGTSQCEELHSSSDTSSDSEDSDCSRGDGGGVPVGCMDTPHDDESMRVEKLRRWHVARAAHLHRHGVRPDSLEQHAPPPAQAESWSAALGDGTRPTSVAPLHLSAPVARRASGHIRLAHIRDTALLLHVSASPIVLDSSRLVIFGSDQDGKSVPVHLEAERGAQLCSSQSPVALILIAERLFPSGSSIAFRNPGAGSRGRRAVVLVVRCKAALDAPQPGGGSIVFMGARPLPPKSPAQLRAEAELACVSTLTQGTTSTRQPSWTSRGAFAILMDAIRAASADADGTAAVLLQNLSIAEAKRKRGSKVLALAYASAALRIHFPNAPPKAAVQAAQILESQKQYACATAVLHAVEAPNRRVRQLMAAVLGKAHRAGERSIPSNCSPALSKVLEANQNTIASGADDNKVDAVMRETPTLASLKRVADAAFRRADYAKATLHWRAALRLLARSEVGEALPHLLMLRSAMWHQVRPNEALPQAHRTLHQSEAKKRCPQLVHLGCAVPCSAHPCDVPTMHQG